MLPRSVRRLPRCTYLGRRRYFLTLLAKFRRPIFVEAELVELCRSQILRAAARTHFAVIASCFMPDHLHLLVEGTTGDANLREFGRRAKQLSAYHAIRRGHGEVWGRGYYDRILRHDEDPRRYLRYIRDNPVRAGLVDDAADYSYLWIDTTSWPDL